MQDRIKESDWKLYSKLAPIALERLCDRILSEIAATSQARQKTSHERYLAVYRLIMDRDKDIAAAFNSRSRSKAVPSLGVMRSLQIVTDDELASFSEETQRTVRFWAGEEDA
jgi:hypothetical protein